MTGEGSRRFADGAVTKTRLSTRVEENCGGMSKTKWTEVFGDDAKRDEKTATDRDGWPTRFRGIKEKKVHWRAFFRGTT